MSQLANITHLLIKIMFYICLRISISLGQHFFLYFRLFSRITFLFSQVQTLVITYLFCGVTFSQFILNVFIVLIKMKFFKKPVLLEVIFFEYQTYIYIFPSSLVSIVIVKIGGMSNSCSSLDKS